ncbi:MAG: repeat-containing protein [Conexibacter sp.]|nr:repeat-containing protein [Conexibacter sp.]
MSVRSRSILPSVLVAALVAVPTARGAGMPPFDAPTVLSVGAGVTDPRSLVAADLDGDGRRDLIAGDRNGDDGRVTVLRNTGDGTFAVPLGGPYDSGVTGTGVGSVAVGDLTGDGHPDVLAALETGAGAGDQLVLLAGDGTGRLTAPGAPILTRTEVSGVALADLDADGSLDALTSHHTSTSSDQLAILPGSGGGLAFHASYGAGATTLATGLAVGQLDIAHGPDALVISAGPAGGSAWVASGTGISLSTASVPVPVGNDPVAVALADVDGDGDQDGLVLDGSAATLTVLRNDGTGVLAQNDVPVAGLAQGSGLAMGDLDGDGHSDAVVTDALGGRAGVLLGDGGGGFDAPQWLAMGRGARTPVVADLTGDGVADVATADAADGTISLRRGAGVPVPRAALSAPFGAEEVGSTGAAASVVITNTGQAGLPVTLVTVRGTAADDFLITGDACTATTVRSGGTDACTVRVRFGPSAPGARSGVVRIHYPGGLLDVPLAGTGIVTPAPSSPAASTTTSAPVHVPARQEAAPAAPATHVPARKPKPQRLLLTLSRTRLTARRGAPLRVGFALGRDAKLVLRIKRAGRTVAVLRATGRKGRGAIRWDGRLGGRPARAGTYRLAVYAVAADGHAARASATLVLRA